MSFFGIHARRILWSRLLLALAALVASSNALLTIELTEGDLVVGRGHVGVERSAVAVRASEPHAARTSWRVLRVPHDFRRGGIFAR